MLTKEARAAKSEVWRQHWQACEASGESMAAYARRHDLNADEGYRWKRIAQRLQRMPASAAVKVKTQLSFARMRIASHTATGSSGPLTLQLLLSNGRRAELTIENEQQLPRVLALLEQPG